MENIEFETISKTLLADTVTPVSLYLKIRDNYTNTLLLEGSDYNSNENSYSFICIEPLVNIKSTKEGELLLEYENNTIERNTIGNDFYSIFDKYKNRIKTNSNEKISSFNGLYGYISFDAIEYFEDIKITNPKAESDIPVLQFGFFKFIIAINHFKNEMTLIENIGKGKISEIEDIETIIQAQSFTNYSFETKGEETSNCSDKEFRQNVSKAKEHCKLGDVFQLVLSRQFKQGFKGDEFNVYRALRSVNPSPYLFYFDYTDFKLMGSSPEAQIKIENNKAVINPIAGTFKRTGNDTEDMESAKRLSKDKKENAEHVMLVDLARNDLSKHANNVEVKTFKEIQYFSHVIHLVSTVVGDINSKSIEMVGGTFPAGTLSGAPKHKALELINKYENQTRGFYGGAVGYIGLDSTVNMAIAIRSFVSKNNNLYYQAGAGIVIHSDEEKELQEVNHKLGALKKALDLAKNI